MLARDRGSAPLPSDHALRSDDVRDLRDEQHAPPAAALVAAIDDSLAARAPASVERPVAEEAEDVDSGEYAEATALPVDESVHPVYTFWDDSGGPPILDDELTLTLVERADGAPFEPWCEVVNLAAVRDMQPKYSVAMPLPAPGLYRATCRDGRYKPIDVWVPDIDHPQVAIVLKPADSAGSGR
jgi:hypothetical protein